MTSAYGIAKETFLPQRLGEVRWGLIIVSINPPLNLPPNFLSFTQKSGEVMELGRSLAKKAFRAKKIPSPRVRGRGIETLISASFGQSSERPGEGRETRRSFG
jgi:hypothetical protein